MSFGIRDEDWVNPDPEPVIICANCEHYEPCPCECGWGWCKANEWHTHETENCQ